ncbi:lachesin-like [Babylonia areolata]|uniref:lachesin-like n=1 Tax=Babylonia areolata TaxID=304850 RepID=UPI003FD33352
MAVLFCSVSDLGDRTVTWRKLPNRNPLTIGTRTWVKDSRIHAEHVPNSSQWNLVIEKVNASDTATYECQVNARGRQQFRHQVHLEVKGIEISGRNFLQQGETIHLQCNTTMVDIAVDSLEWLKDSRPLRTQVDPPGRMTVTTTASLTTQLAGSISSVLEIRGARVSDGGLYVCRSTERSQLAGVTLTVKPAENIQQYTGAANGQPCFSPARAVLVTLVSVTFLYRSSVMRLTPSPP